MAAAERSVTLFRGFAPPVAAALAHMVETNTFAQALVQINVDTVFAVTSREFDILLANVLLR